MPKYSTGDSSGGGDSCELCGTETGNLTTATVAGAELQLCRDCVPHGETTTERRKSAHDDHETEAQREQNSRRRAAQNVARFADAGMGNSKRWEEEGTNYDSDQLPYLVSGYGDRARDAREDADLDVEDLADELDVAANDIRAIEEGSAARAGVGGSVVAALESRLDVRLVDE